MLPLDCFVAALLAVTEVGQLDLITL